MKQVDLSLKEIIGSHEAALMWGKQKDYVRTIYNKRPDRFPQGTIRKFGKQLVVTQEGMEAVTGHKALYTEKEVIEKDKHKG